MRQRTQSHPRQAPPDSRPHHALPGELAVLTCYFNPCDYRSRRENYRRFSQEIRTQGVELFTAELAFDDRPFALDRRSDTFRFRSRHVLWHKERLLNVLLQQVPARFDKIAWIDADLLFENLDWPVDAARLLEQFPVVQLFEHAAYVNSNGRPEAGRNSVGWASLHDLGNAGNFNQYHPGFAWAARREIVDQHGLLDCQILGGGDSSMVCSMFGWWEHPHLTSHPPGLREAILEWGWRFWQDVRARIGVVPGQVIHLWHGERVNRHYIDRIGWLVQAGFDPGVHLREGHNLLWEWQDDGHWLAERARQYFHERHEDLDPSTYARPRIG